MSAWHSDGAELCGVDGEARTRPRARLCRHDDAHVTTEHVRCGNVCPVDDSCLSGTCVTPTPTVTPTETPTSTPPAETLTNTPTDTPVSPTDTPTKTPTPNPETPTDTPTATPARCPLGGDPTACTSNSTALAPPARGHQRVGASRSSAVGRLDVADERRPEPQTAWYTAGQFLGTNTTALLVVVFPDASDVA